MNKGFITFILLMIIVFCNNAMACAKTIGKTNETYAVKEDGELWRWKDDTNNAEKILDNVKNVNGDLAIKNDNTLWECSGTPIKISDNIEYATRYISSFIFLVKNDNTLWCSKLENSENYSQEIKVMNDVSKIDVGWEHIIILKTDGSVWTFGDNSYGQLGVGEDIEYSEFPIKVLDQVKDIFAGESSSFAVDRNNTLYRWGSNYGNGVGLKPTDFIYTPVQYTDNVKTLTSHWGFNLILKQDGTLWIYGDSEDEKNAYTDLPTGISFTDLPRKLVDDVNDIAGCNSSNTHRDVILKNNGDLFSFDLMEGRREHTPEYKIEKIIDKVRVADEPVEIVEENESLIVAIKTRNRAKILEWLKYIVDKK